MARTRRGRPGRRPEFWPCGPQDQWRACAWVPQGQTVEGRGDTRTIEARVGAARPEHSGLACRKARMFCAGSTQGQELAADTTRNPGEGPGDKALDCNNPRRVWHLPTLLTILSELRSARLAYPGRKECGVIHARMVTSRGWRAAAGPSRDGYRGGRYDGRPRLGPPTLCWLTRSRAEEATGRSG